MIEFKSDFFWGAATSAHQVEGNNVHNDWWHWEKNAGLKEPSRDACRHYSLYKEDFRLAKSLHHNAHRFSVEWSRIEPEENKFSAVEIDHYRDVVRSLRELNIEPIVTLHHFTNPQWFSRLGGWENSKARNYFLRYVREVVSALCEDVRYWVTINEPMVYTYHSYVLGQWPPQKKSLSAGRRVERNLKLAHIDAYRLIHSIYREKKLSSPFVSIAKNIQDFVPCFGSLKNRVSVYLKNVFFNFGFIETLLKHKALDFIGINYYTRALVEARSWRPQRLLVDLCENNHSCLSKNTMGWDIYPQGLHEILLRLKKYKLPIFILENGLCTEDDGQRWIFIRDHLENLHRAVQEGAAVMGYLYWSLLDNYEWDKGFGPRFGIIEVDYVTYRRVIRESGRKFAEVCRGNALKRD